MLIHSVSLITFPRKTLRHGSSLSSENSADIKTRQLIERHPECLKFASCSNKKETKVTDLTSDAFFMLRHRFSSRNYVNSISKSFQPVLDRSWPDWGTVELKFKATDKYDGQVRRTSTTQVHTTPPYTYFPPRNSSFVSSVLFFFFANYECSTQIESRFVGRKMPQCVRHTEHLNIVPRVFLVFSNPWNDRLIDNSRASIVRLIQPPCVFARAIESFSRGWVHAWTRLRFKRRTHVQICLPVAVYRTPVGTIGAFPAWLPCFTWKFKLFFLRGKPTFVPWSVVCFCTEKGKCWRLEWLYRANF